MTNQESVAFMRDLERRYREASGLPDRSQYKMFYGLVRPAEMLVLGKNPSGDPADVLPDGCGSRSGRRPHAASASFYEKDESDVLDCEWTENRGLLKLLVPIAGGDAEALRSRMVKTNVAFRRAKKVPVKVFETWKVEAAPFLAEIVGRVRPRIIILAGAALDDFVGRHCSSVRALGDTIKDPGIRQVVWRAVRAELRATGETTVVVQVAHASQFSWTYERYAVADRINALRAGGSAGQ